MISEPAMARRHLFVFERKRFAVNGKIRFGLMCHLGLFLQKKNHAV